MRTVPLLLATAFLLAALAAPSVAAQVPALPGEAPFDCLVGSPDGTGIACFDPGTHEFCLIMFHNGWIDADICPGG